MTPSQFLFDLRPDTVPFLTAMGVVVAAACGWTTLLLWRAPARADAAAEGYDPAGAHAGVSPREHIEGACRVRSASAVLGAVGPLLVTIGILGTFIGLGLAVGIAGDAMAAATADADLAASLRTLLERVAIKFQTSAWGVLLSVVFVLARAGVLALLASIARPRVAELQARAAREASERSAEALARANEDRAVLLDMRDTLHALQAGVTAQTNALGEACAALAAASTSLTTVSGELRQTMGHMRQQADVTTTAQRNAAGALARSAEDLPKSMSGPMADMKQAFTDALTRLDNGLTRATGDLAQRMDASLTTLADQSKAAGEAQTGALSGALADMRHALSTTSAEQSARLDDALKKLEAASAKSANDVAGALGAMAERSEKAGADQARSLSDALEDLKTSMDATGRAQAQRLDNALQKLEAASAKSANDVAGALGSMAERSEKAGAAQTKLLTDALNDVKTSMDVTGRAQAQRLDDALKKLEAASARSAKDIAGALGAMAERSEKAGAAQATSLAAALRALESASANTSKRLHDSLDGMGKTLKAASDDQRAATRDLQGSIGSSLDKVDVALGRSNDYQAELTGVTKNLRAVNAELAEQLKRFTDVMERMTRKAREQALDEAGAQLAAARPIDLATPDVAAPRPSIRRPVARPKRADGALPSAEADVDMTKAFGG